jgi:hypothetical protein
MVDWTTTIACFGVEGTGQTTKNKYRRSGAWMKTSTPRLTRHGKVVHSDIFRTFLRFSPSDVPTCLQDFETYGHENTSQSSLVDDVLAFTLYVSKVLARSRRVLNRSVELRSLQLLPLEMHGLKGYEVNVTTFRPTTHTNSPIMGQHHLTTPPVELV